MEVTVEDRSSLINGFCVATGALSERVVVARNLIDSSYRIGDAIESARSPYRTALITFAAIGFGLAIFNAVAYSRRNYW